MRSTTSGVWRTIVDDPCYGLFGSLGSDVGQDQIVWELAGVVVWEVAPPAGPWLGLRRRSNHLQLQWISVQWHSIIHFISGCVV